MTVNEWKVSIANEPEVRGNLPEFIIDNFGWN